MEEKLEVHKENKKKLSGGKIALIVISSILIVILLIFGILYGVFFNEVNAVLSINEEREGVYSMNYNNNYYFDEFLEAGASNDSELLKFISDKLLKGLPIDIKIPDLGCSSFTATTEDNNRIFARNFDLNNSPILILKTDPKDAYKSISTVNLDFLGYRINNLPDSLIDKILFLAAPYMPLDGVNEKGVSISVNMVSGDATSQDTGKINITTTTLIRLVLDYASSVDQAIELISKYDLQDSANSPYHYQIADRNGDSAIIEYIDNEMKIIRKTGDFLHQTNFILSNFAPEDYNDRCNRYKTITDALTKTKGIASKEDAMMLLKDVTLDLENYITQWSVVFDLTNLTATYSYYLNYEEKYVFSL